MLTGIQPIALNATTRLFASHASIRLVVDGVDLREVLGVDGDVAAGDHVAVLDPGVGARQDAVRRDDAADAVPRHDVAVLAGGDERRVGGDDGDVAAGVARRRPRMYASTVVRTSLWSIRP